MYISTPPSPKVENFQIKIYYPAGDWTPNLLNQRQTCYHLSQRSELIVRVIEINTVGTYIFISCTSISCVIVCNGGVFPPQAIVVLKHQHLHLPVKWLNERPAFSRFTKLAIFAGITERFKIHFSALITNWHTKMEKLLILPLEPPFHLIISEWNLAHILFQDTYIIDTEFD